jgi:hypothetical protein
MNRSPLVTPPRFTGTYTLVAGRRAAGRVKGEPVPCAMAPLKWTIPLMLLTAALEVPKGVVQPFLSVSG